jgi:hypothetical protein
MDYDKTLQIYKSIGQAKLWKKESDHYRHDKEKAWYDKVKSKGCLWRKPNRSS